MKENELLAVALQLFYCVNFYKAVALGFFSGVVRSKGWLGSKQMGFFSVSGGVDVAFASCYCCYLNELFFTSTSGLTLSLDAVALLCFGLERPLPHLFCADYMDGHLFQTEFYHRL